MLYLNIFKRSYVNNTPRTGLHLPTDLNLVKKHYINSYEKIEQYFLSRSFFIKNTHIVPRILELLPTYLAMDNVSYLEYSDRRSIYIGKHFRFTSEIEHGISHPSYFFGNDGDEIITSIYESVNPFNPEPAIRVLSCNRSDDQLLLPIGFDNGNSFGLDVVNINISILGLLYRDFMRSVYLQNHSDEYISHSKNVYTMKKIIPPMMKSIIDHIWLNKLMNRFYSRKDTQSRKTLPIKSLVVPTKQLDRLLLNVIDNINNKRMDYVDVLRSIPLPFSGDASALLSFDAVPLNRQLRWAIVASRMDHMLFLYDLEGLRDYNRHHLQDWKTLANRMARDKDYVQGQFSYAVEKEINEKLYRLRNI